MSPHVSFLNFTVKDEAASTAQCLAAQPITEWIHDTSSEQNLKQARESSECSKHRN